MALKLVTAPENEPITLEEAKRHLNVVDDDWDALITAMIQAARQYAERFLGRALIDQTWDYFVDQFPTGNAMHHDQVVIPLPPLIEVVGVFYRDADDVEQQYDESSYIVDDASEPGRISISSSGSWPTTRDGTGAVRIRFRAGYIDSSTSPATDNVPEDIRAAILLHVGSLYEHRETVVVGQTATQIPWGAEQLLRMRRIDLSMA